MPVKTWGSSQQLAYFIAGQFLQKAFIEMTGRRQKKIREDNCSTVKFAQNPHEKSKNDQTKGPSGCRYWYAQAKVAITSPVFLLHSCIPLERIAGSSLIKTRNPVHPNFCASWSQPQDPCGIAADISSLQSTEQRA